MIAGRRVQHRRELQADEDEHQSVQEEFHRVPNRARVEPGLKIGDFGQSPAEIQTGGHDRQHAGNAQSFRRQICGKRRQQRNRDFNRRILDVFMKLGR